MYIYNTLHYTGLDFLGLEVVKGRKARLMLKLCRDIRQSSNLIITEKLQNMIIEDIPKEDSYLPDFVSILKEQVLQKDFDVMEVNALEQQMIDGNESEKKMIVYHDYLITAMNLSNPPDASSNERDSEENFPEMHPCSNGHRKHDGTHDVGGESEDLTYISLCNFCERHRHNKGKSLITSELKFEKIHFQHYNSYSIGYCLKDDGTCRFGFPKELNQHTKVIITDQSYKKDENAGKLRRTVVTIKAKTNDKWLNSHNSIAILCWLANMDISLLVDSVSVIAYVAKYASKVDTVSVVINKIISGAITHGTEIGILEPSRVLRRTFNRISGRRDKCTQEISHLIMSDQYVYCSHKFTTINLKSLIRKVNINSNGLGNALVKNIVDLYSMRKTKDNWRDKNLYDTVIQNLSNMSLVEFVEIYSAGKDSTIVKRSGDTSHTISIFSPEFGPSKISSSYYKYCWVSLLKFKPWENFTELTFGDITDKGSCIDMDIISTEIQIRIINAWENFHNNNAHINELYREINRLQEPIEIREDNDNNIVQSQIGNFEPADNQPDYASIFQSISNEEEEVSNIDWTKNVDFNTTTNIYEMNEYNTSYIKEKWKSLRSEVHVQLRPTTLLPNLQTQQQLCVKTFLHICGLMKDENGIFLERRIDDNSTVPNGMIIIGTAGTGKSYTINGMINEIINRKLEKNEEKTVLVMAPTGRAAMQANGFTLQCKDGLSIPLFTGTSISLIYYIYFIIYYYFYVVIFTCNM